MRIFIALIYIISLLTGISIGRDPFINKEDAVGYIVIDNEGVISKYIVIESNRGKVKLIKTDVEPERVLKQGGKEK